MPELSESVFEQGLSDKKDIYVVEGAPTPTDEEHKVPLFHLVVGEGEMPDEDEVAERVAIWSEHSPTAPRLLSYEELAEKQRLRSQAWGQIERGEL